MKRILKRIYRILAFVISVNWVKTIRINFKLLPFKQAKKMPILIFGSVKIGDLSGKIIFNCPIKIGLLLFGYKYEMNTMSDKTEYLKISGEIVVNGIFACGSCYHIIWNKNSKLILGHLSSLGRSGTIICTKYIELGDYARIGFNSVVSDSNYHKMIDLETNKILPMNSSIIIGNYNYVGSNVAIQTKTITPNFCTIASFSLCSKDYTNLGENILLAGYPAKLVRNNIVRDWDGEKESLMNSFDIENKFRRNKIL